VVWLLLFGGYWSLVEVSLVGGLVVVWWFFGRSFVVVW